MFRCVADLLLSGFCFDLLVDRAAADEHQDGADGQTEDAQVPVSQDAFAEDGLGDDRSDKAGGEAAQVDAGVHDAQQGSGSGGDGGQGEELAEVRVVHFEAETIQHSTHHQQGQATAFGGSEVDDHAYAEEQDAGAGGEVLEDTAPHSGVEQAAHGDGHGKDGQHVCCGGRGHAHAASFHSGAGDDGDVGHECVGEQ